MRVQDILQHVAIVMEAHGLENQMIDQILGEASEAIEAELQAIRFSKLQRAQRRAKAGRPAMTEDQLKQAAELLRNTDLTARQIGNKVGVARSTLYKYLKPDGTARKA